MDEGNQHRQEGELDRLETEIQELLQDTPAESSRSLDELLEVGSLDPDGVASFDAGQARRIAVDLAGTDGIRPTDVLAGGAGDLGLGVLGELLKLLPDRLLGEVVEEGRTEQLVRRRPLVGLHSRRPAPSQIFGTLSDQTLDTALALAGAEQASRQHGWAA